MLGDLHEVAHQVQKLLPRGQRITKPTGMSDDPLVARCSIVFLEIVSDFPVLPGVASTTMRRPFFGQQTADGPSVISDDRDRLVSLFDGLRWLEDRLDQLRVGEVLSQLRSGRGQDGRTRRTLR